MKDKSGFAATGLPALLTLKQCINHCGCKYYGKDRRAGYEDSDARQYDLNHIKHSRKMVKPETHSRGVVGVWERAGEYSHALARAFDWPRQSA